MLKWLTPIKCIETTNFKLTSSVIVAANISEYILNLCIILTLYNNVNWFLSSNHWFQVGKLLHGMKKFFDSFTQRSKNFSLLIAFWQWMSWQFACIMQRRCRIHFIRAMNATKHRFSLFLENMNHHRSSECIISINHPKVWHITCYSSFQCSFQSNDRTHAYFYGMNTFISHHLFLFTYFFL